MGKVPFISPSRLFGTGAIKARQCYLSLQKGLVERRDEGKTGEERGKEENRPVEIGRIGRSNCLSFFIPMSLPFFPALREPSSLWCFLSPIFSFADTCCRALLDSASCCQETHSPYLTCLQLYSQLEKRHSLETSLPTKGEWIHFTVW